MFLNRNPKITRSQVRSPCRLVWFLLTLGHWGRLRGISKGRVMVQCKIVGWCASKNFPMELLVRVLVGSSRLVWEKNVSQLLFLQEQCVQRAHLSLFGIIITLILFILLLRARVLSRYPKVKSPWFETRCGKIILFSDFPVVGVVRAKV